MPALSRSAARQERPTEECAEHWCNEPAPNPAGDVGTPWGWPPQSCRHQRPLEIGQYPEQLEALNRVRDHYGSPVSVREEVPLDPPLQLGLLRQDPPPPAGD